METMELYSVAGIIILSFSVCFGPYFVPDVNVE